MICSSCASRFWITKNLMQERIPGEVVALISDIKKDINSGKKVTSIQDKVNKAVGSVINTLTFGYCFGRVSFNVFIVLFYDFRIKKQKSKRTS